MFDIIVFRRLWLWLMNGGMAVDNGAPQQDEGRRRRRDWGIIFEWMPAATVTRASFLMTSSYARPFWRPWAFSSFCRSCLTNARSSRGSRRNRCQNNCYKERSFGFGKEFESFSPAWWQILNPSIRMQCRDGMHGLTFMVEIKENLVLKIHGSEFYISSFTCRFRVSSGTKLFSLLGRTCLLLVLIIIPSS